MTTRKPKPLPLLPELNRSGFMRVTELRELFSDMVNARCLAVMDTSDDKRTLTIPEAERAVFDAAQSVVETLRGSVRRSERTGK